MYLHYLFTAPLLTHVLFRLDIQRRHLQSFKEMRDLDDAEDKLMPETEKEVRFQVTLL
jgi:hypothetical protein